jgi:myo-inositol-1(or 4)-monophosphatase
MPWSSELEAMIQAAENAAERLRADFARADGVTVTEKGPADFVSSADLASQEILQRELGDAFPDHELVLEEGGARPDAGRRHRGRLLVDPLDGTTNFLMRIPHFAVSIALEAGGAITGGVVLNAASGELFCAERGRGAWVRAAAPRRLQVSAVRELRNAVIGTGIPNRGGPDHVGYLSALRNVMGEVAGVRRFGSAALDLAYVAAGRFAAFFERGLAPWDVSAGSLLVTEAGGFVSRSDGAESLLDDGDILAACSREVQTALIERLAPLHSKHESSP